MPAKADRRKQTRLSFTPAASSSPSRPEVHIRVDHPSTPSKRRRVVNDSGSDSPHRQPSPDIAKAIEISKRDHNLHFLLQSPQSDFDQLPTPGPSSQLEPPGTDRRRQRHPRGVNFANPIPGEATKSSPDLRHDTILSDSEDVRNVLRSGKKGRNVHPTTISSSESSEEESPPPRRSRPPTVRSFLLGGSSGTAPIPRAQMTNTRRFSVPKRTADARPDFSSSDEDRIRTTENLHGRSTRYDTRQCNREQTTKDGKGEEELNAIPITPSRRRTLIRRKAHLNRTEEDENESDTVPITPSRRRTSARRRETSSEEDDEEDDEEEDDSDVVVTSPLKKRRISQHPKKSSEEDDDSMLEELDTVHNKESKRQTRQGRGNSARSKRLHELKKLKQRRAGVVESPEDEEEEYEDEQQDEDPPTDTDHGAAVDEERRNTDLDEYESDFVEDDGDLGIDLMKHGVPLELTGHANKKQYDYFKHAVEWMIHNKLDPAFERNDEIYEMAHRKLNDEYLGLASSEFKSSVWTPEFIKALQSRPELSTLHLGLEIMEGKCQACNRSKHPAKWLITFSGPTYDPKSLEKVAPRDINDSSSESNEETDEAEEKEEEWQVGSVCCGNAEVTHSLYHWRFQLNAVILEWLVINKHTEPLQIVEREEWSRRKKEKFANRIVDDMVENGEMKSLYKEFKENLDAAIAARAEKTQHGGWKGKRR